MSFNDMVIQHEEHINSLQHQIDDHKESDTKNFDEIKELCRDIKTEIKEGNKDTLSRVKYIMDANLETIDNKYQNKEDAAGERLKTAMEVGALSGKFDTLKSTFVTGISSATGVLSVVLIGIEIYGGLN